MKRSGLEELYEQWRSEDEFGCLEDCPSGISYRRRNGNVGNVSLSPVIRSPVKNVAVLNNACSNERVTCQALATLIRTQYNKSNPLKFSSQQ